MSVSAVQKYGQKMIKEVKMNFIEEFTKLEHQLVFFALNPENEEVRVSIEILIVGIINNIDSRFIRNNKTIIYNLWLVLETYYRDKADELIPDYVFDILERKFNKVDPDFLTIGIENNPLGRVSLWKHKEIIKEE